MLACIIIAYKLAKHRGYYSDLVFDIAICCLPLAIVGARLYYVIFDIIDGGDWDFPRFFGFRDGKFEGLSGLAIYGGLIGACFGAFIVKALQKKKPEYERVTFLQMADLAFAVVLLGQCIGRWGNFANQEAYGNYVGQESWFPYAVYITDPKGVGEIVGWYQATFFYESLWNAIGFALILWMYLGKRKSFDGFILSMYCIFYGTGRIFIEGLRSDSLWLVPGVVRVSQVVSALIIIFGLVMILRHVYRARVSEKKVFIMVPEAMLSGEYLDYEKSMLYRRTLKPVEEADIAEDEAEETTEYFGAEQAEAYYNALDESEATGSEAADEAELNDGGTNGDDDE